VSRKYSVLFVALAFVVAMAVSASALSIPSYTGRDQTATPNQTNIDIVGVSIDQLTPGANGRYTAQPLWWSGDVEDNNRGLVVRVRSHDVPTNLSEDYLGFALADNTPYEILAGSGTFTTSKDISADAVLLYLGRGVRDVAVTFSADSTDNRAKLLSFRLTQGTVFNRTMTATRSEFWPDQPLSGISADQFELAGTVCAAGDCNTFFRDLMQVWSGDLVNSASAARRMISSDLSMFFYMPCGDFVKDWQVYNRLPYDVATRATAGAGDLDTVYPQDMVRYSNSVAFDHNLVLGPYVVEKYRAGSALAANDLPDVLVERILNQSGASMSADLRLPADGTTYFNWRSLGQQRYAQDGFRAISVDLRPQGAVQDTAYLRFQEWDTNRTDAFGYTWYTWFGTTDAGTAYKDAKGVSIAAGALLDLAPGFARYYIYSADETGNIEMCFTEHGVAGGERFCQETTIDPQIWVKDGCITGDDYNWADCFGAVTMSADNSVRSDLATWTGITAPVFTTESDACGSCAGQITLRTDVNTLREPFASLNACEGSTVCLGASLDVTITGDPSCSYNLEDIQLTRLTFKVAPQRICDETVRANVAAAVAKLGDNPLNKPENVAPADAFLNPASVDATLGAGLDVVVVLPDGTKANLVELAKANEYLDATLGYQGIKNYFEVWAEQNMSVWEAWKHSVVANREVFLSFHVAIVNGDAPEGQAAIQAKKGYFLIYAGDANESLANMVPAYRTFYALMTGFDPNCGDTPTPTPVPAMTVTSDPSGSTEAVDCATFTKESFSSEAWAAILTALGVTDENAYTFSFSGVDCLTSDVASLTAGQSVAYTVTYDDGIASAGTGTTARNVFVYNVADGVYDLLPEVASEVSIATEQTKNAVIAEGSEYDANEAADALQVGFSLVSGTATPISTPTSAPSGGGSSGCSFGFAPLALLLLAPLALLRK